MPNPKYVDPTAQLDEATAAVHTEIVRRLSLGLPTAPGDIFSALAHPAEPNEQPLVDDVFAMGVVERAAHDETARRLAFRQLTHPEDGFIALTTDVPAKLTGMKSGGETMWIASTRDERNAASGWSRREAQDALNRAEAAHDEIKQGAASKGTGAEPDLQELADAVYVANDALRDAIHAADVAGLEVEVTVGHCANCEVQYPDVTVRQVLEPSADDDSEDEE